MIKINLSTIMGQRKIKSMRELARIAGLRPNTVSSLWHEKAWEVRLDVLDRLCKVLECNVGDLLEYTEGKQKERRIVTIAEWNADDDENQTTLELEPELSAGQMEQSAIQINQSAIQLEPEQSAIQISHSAIQPEPEPEPELELELASEPEPELASEPASEPAPTPEPEPEPAPTKKKRGRPKASKPQN